MGCTIVNNRFQLHKNRIPNHINISKIYTLLYTYSNIFISYIYTPPKQKQQKTQSYRIINMNNHRNIFISSPAVFLHIYPHKTF